jgi:oxygen-dependent protoporphyrinogen oxidase
MLLGPKDVLKFSVIPLPERLRLLLLLIKLKFGKPKNFFSLLPSGKQSAAEFIAKNIGPAMRDYVADGFTALMQFHRSDDIDAGAMIALLSMMVSKEHAFLIHATKGGVQAIPDALAQHLNVKCDVAIESVTPTKKNIEIAIKGKNRRFDTVVLATPAPIAQKLLTLTTLEQKKVLDAVTYASTIVVSFKIPHYTALEQTFCTYVPFVENHVISGYTNEGRKGGEYTNKQYALLNVYLHEGAAKELMNASDDIITKKVKAELTKVCEVPSSKLIFNDIQRWPLAMPKFNTKLITAVQAFWLHQGQNNIFFTGDYLNSPWTEGAARCGKKVAMLVHQQLNRKG